MSNVHSLKFRGFSREQNKWLYGFRAKSNYQTYIADDNPAEVIHISPETALIKFSRVESASLGVFTCATDMAGNELYTGDVFLIIWDNQPIPDEPKLEELYVVCYDGQGFYGQGISGALSYEMFSQALLVGNTFDNPEYVEILNYNIPKLTDEELENLKSIIESEGLKQPDNY